ncbi:MAG: LamG domain-containing protein [Myxococcales bacterium]|nr:LamG domain-containing protein [Myxococcales bacterium]
MVIRRAFAVWLMLGFSGCSADFGGRCTENDECAASEACTQGYCLPADQVPDMGVAPARCGPGDAWDAHGVPCPDEATLALWRFDDGFTPIAGPGQTAPTLTEGDPIGVLRVDAPAFAGGAAEFFGDSGQQYGHSGSVRAAPPFTVELWVRPGAAADNRHRALISNVQRDGDANRRGGFSVIIDQIEDNDPTRYRAGFEWTEGRGTTEVYSDAVLPRGVWGHVAVVVDAGRLHIVVNGEDAEFDAPNLPDRGADLQLGRIADDRDRQFVGLLDEVRLSNSAREVSALQAIGRRAAP